MKFVYLLAAVFLATGCSSLKKNSATSAEAVTPRNPASARWTPVAEITGKLGEPKSSVISDANLESCQFRAVSYKPDGSPKLIAYPTSVWFVSQSDNREKYDRKLTFAYKRYEGTKAMEVFGFDVLIKEGKVIFTDIDYYGGSPLVSPKAELQMRCDS